MKDKIKDILNTYDKAFVPDKILDLLKQEGWLHKDDPVKGLKVEKKLDVPTDIKNIERPLTVGEALEKIGGLLHIAKQVCKVGCIHRATPTDEPLWACKSCWVGKNLTTSDGGRIVREG